MIAKRSLVLVAAGLVAGLVLGGTVVAVAATSTSQVKVCVTGKGAVRSASKSSSCPAGTRKRSINVTGPQGPSGPQGPAGPAAIRINQVITPPTTGTAITGTSMTLDCKATTNRVTLWTQTTHNFYGSYRKSGAPQGATWWRENGGDISMFDDSLITVDFVEFDPATGSTSHVVATVTYAFGTCRVHGVVTPAA